MIDIYLINIKNYLNIFDYYLIKLKQTIRRTNSKSNRKCWCRHTLNMQNQIDKVVDTHIPVGVMYKVSYLNRFLYIKCLLSPGQI